MKDQTIAFLFRGLPGSGKTTIIEKYKLWGKMAVVSPDLERAAFPMVDGDDGFPVYDQRVSRRAWQNAYLRAGMALSEGVDVVFDATFMSKWALNGALENIHADEVIVVDFQIDASTAKARNANRWGKPNYVPDSVIDRMAKSGKAMSFEDVKVISLDEFIEMVA